MSEDLRPIWSSPSEVGIAVTGTRLVVCGVVVALASPDGFGLDVEPKSGVVKAVDGASPRVVPLRTESMVEPVIVRNRAALELLSPNALPMPRP